MLPVCDAKAWHAVVYNTSMRPAKHEGPAVRMLSWNVASLRSTLKQVKCRGIWQFRRSLSEFDATEAT